MQPGQEDHLVDGEEEVVEVEVHLDEEGDGGEVVDQLEEEGGGARWSHGAYLPPTGSAIKFSPQVASIMYKCTYPCM